MHSLDWQDYLRAYEEQKRLEQHQQVRTLPRPKTTKITVVLHVALLLAIQVCLAVVLFVCSPLERWINTLVFILWICVTESYGRLLGIKLVECYQHYAAEETRRKCKCVPSCSEYAIICLKKYELIYALLKIRRRLFVTCKGFDYIIDNP